MLFVPCHICHVNSLFPYESSLTRGNDEASLYLQLRDFHMAFQSSRGIDRVNVHHFIQLLNRENWSSDRCIYWAPWSFGPPEVLGRKRFHSAYMKSEGFHMTFNRVNRPSRLRDKFITHFVPLGPIKIVEKVPGGPYNRGRHTRPRTPITDRLCPKCEILEDEVHFPTSCDLFTTDKDILFSRVTTMFSDFQTQANHEKIIFMLCYPDRELLAIVGKFIYNCFQVRNSLV